MKYYILSTKKYEKISSNINLFIEKEGFKTELIIEKNNLSYVKKAIEISEKIVELGRNNASIILIDETGGLGFVSTAKVKGMITAQISDEHSSHMTKEHNGSIGLSLGAEILVENQLKSIVKIFINEKFAAGRHMVRVDMLNKLA